MQLIGDVLRLNAKRYPDKKAVIMRDDSLTFSQLNKQANQLANGLLWLGIRPGDKVALLAFNCLEYVFIQYAVVKCGGVIIPVNFRNKKDELAYIINNSEPKVLFFGPEFISLVDEAKSEFASSLYLVAISGESIGSRLSLADLLEGRSSREPAVDLDPSSAFIITYTSGTTGAPKGVLASHSAFLDIYAGMVVEGDIRHTDVTLVALPLFHTGGMHALLQPTLLMGGTAVIMGIGFEPDRILDAVERYRVTLTMWVPTMLAMLVNHPRVGSYTLSTLEKIWYGSSAISPALLQTSRDIFKASFYQFYGTTETGMVSVLRPEDHLERSQYTGREMFNADLRIVDDEGNDVPVGGVGEIISAHKPLGMIGYHHMEEATQRTIRKGWVHTGDLARVEGNGYFTIIDRMTDMIVSGAENIYPREIENVISDYPGVKEVVVFGIPDEIYGESVCAYVVRKEGYILSAEEIISFCASKIASYKKPRHVEFIEELPRNPSGKAMKHVLRDPYWADRKRRV